MNAATIVFLFVAAVSILYAAMDAHDRKQAAAWEADRAAHAAAFRQRAEAERDARRAAEKQRAAEKRRQDRAAKAEREAAQAARRAAKLEAARQLAEYKERALQAEKDLRVLKAAPAPVQAAPIETPAETPAPVQTAPVQLSIDDFAALIAAKREKPAAEADAPPEQPQEPAVKIYNVQASAAVDFNEYQIFGCVKGLELDLSTFAPDAAFLLERFPAFAYYLEHSDLLPAERIIDIYCGEPGTRNIPPAAHYTIPASELYAAR